MPAIALLKGVLRPVSAAALLLSIVSSSAAQRTAAAPWREVVVDSKIVGKRTVYVTTPAGYERGNSRFAVLILLDAEVDEMFRLGLAQAVYLAENADGVPPMIVVGIVNGADRIHDMTPAPTGSSVAEFKTAGGASAFADFILREVLPTVRAKYRTLPTTVLAGWSAGGLFALDVAANRPGSFQGIVAMDPAIWFNDGRPAQQYADAIAGSTARQRVFAAHGRSPNIDTTTRRFAQRLDSIKPPWVGFAHRHYPFDSHSVVPMSALPDGLRFVFEPVATEQLPIANLDVRADSAAVMQALTTSQSLYAEAARSLLLPEQLPEPALNRLARFVLNTLENVGLSILLLQRNVELHPESARALARLAEGYLARGDTAAAVVQLRRAIALSKSSPTELPPDARATLQKLERRKSVSAPTSGRVSRGDLQRPDSPR